MLPPYVTVFLAMVTCSLYSGVSTLTCHQCDKCLDPFMTNQTTDACVADEHCFTSRRPDPPYDVFQRGCANVTDFNLGLRPNMTAPIGCYVPYGYIYHLCLCNATDYCNQADDRDMLQPIDAGCTQITALMPLLMWMIGLFYVSVLY